jgi:O-methyltransferase
MKVLEQRNKFNEVLYFLRWQLGLVLLTLPHHLAFVLRGIGSRQVGFWKRARLATQLIWIHLRIPCVHSPAELLAVVEEIVSLPPTIRGVIVECGCFKGGSSAKLSLAARAAGRQLIVCDSFQGLPPPESTDRVNELEAFQRGDFASRLEEVEKNVQSYGDPAVVQFVPGWYEESLGQLAGVEIACMFLDVDLQESIKSCLIGLWHSLASQGKVFVHDVDRPPVVEPFQDYHWWSRHVDSTLPKFVGAGSGLGWQKRLLGYAIKP